MGADVHSIRFLRGGHRQHPGSRPIGGRLLPAALALAVIAVLAAIVWNVGSERRALRTLSGEQRRELLSHTVEEMRQFCGPGRPEALRTHCRELASFASQFAECRGECETLVRIELAPPPPR